MPEAQEVIDQLADEHWTFVDSLGDGCFIADCKCGWTGPTHVDDSGEAHPAAERDRHQHLFEVAIDSVEGGTFK
jgi:hypothetical protein